MSDQEQAALESALASEEPAETTAESVEQPFYSYKDRDGNVMDFKTPEDVGKFFEKGIMRHSQYDKSMRDLSAKEKQILEERQKIQSEVSRLEEMRGKYDKYDQFFSTPRGQEVYNRLTREYKGIRPDDVISEAKQYADTKAGEVQEQLKSELDEFKAWKDEQQRQADEAWVHEQLAQQYEGYDRSIVDATMKEMEELSSLPEREQTKALYDLIYQAKQGNMNVASVEQKFAQTKPTNKGLSSSKAETPSKAPEPADLDEAEEMMAKMLEAG